MSPTHRRLLASLSLGTAAVLAAVAIGASGHRSTRKADAACPPGQVHEADTGGSTSADAQNADQGVPPCVSILHPESFRDLAAVNGQINARTLAGMGQIANGALLAAATQQQQLAALAGAGPVVPGGNLPWRPVGTPPLIADGAPYSSVNNEGFGNLSGRVQAFAADPARPGRLFAGIAGGGVFESDDGGGSWRSIGDTLPDQTVGAVAWTAVNGGTLVVGTGDPAFGGDSASGLGVFTSTDGGQTWHHAGGVPETLTFRLVVDPTNPSVIYAATGKGLWRSTDAGANFVNVALPTTCANVATPTCFFANIVTDVVVRPSGPGAGQGGAVLAAVGWRAGPRLNANGGPQSPRNGIYVSKTGNPGSFAYVTHSGDGFAAQALIGRTALGVARGAGQNHDVVFALVEDAGKFNKSNTVLDLPEPTGLAPEPTVLNGVYVSQDFGGTWKRLADAVLFEPCGTGSALCGTQTATYSPGVQSWYNEWIEPDPTRQDAKGRPTRVVLGLEEMWQNDPTLPTGQIAYDLPATPTGLTNFRVFGRYFGGTSCLGLRLSLPVPCPLNAPDLRPTSTTHPDQHAGLFVPDGQGGLTLLVGNDGGVYRQHVAAGQALSNAAWGRGANIGLNTLQPYDAAMAKDGTVYAGTQDNGEMKITPSGQEYEVYGGDAFYTAVDPNNSNTAYEEYTAGDMSVTTDGGKTWTDINPGLDNALFATPIQMDPTDATHLVEGGREVAETTAGSNTGKSTNGVTVDAGDSWQFVYDLGTAANPGQPPGGLALPTVPIIGPLIPNLTHDVANQTSAIDTRGAATYVGFCGYCDIVTQGVPFARGIATNVGGTQPPKRLTSQGWHIAKAAGLPDRYITSIRIDPANQRTVYVTLGGYARRWVVPGALGDNVSKVGTGHVFKSTDAGEHFVDVTGNLPDVPASWTVIHDGQLVVATDLGVYVAPTTNGGQYRVLGAGLPNAAVFHIGLAPQSKDTIIAATYGRGVWAYNFTAKSMPVSPPKNQPVKPPVRRVGTLPTTGQNRPWLPWAGASALFAVLGLGLLRRPSRVSTPP